MTEFSLFLLPFISLATMIDSLRSVNPFSAGIFAGMKFMVKVGEGLLSWSINLKSITSRHRLHLALGGEVELDYFCDGRHVINGSRSWDT